MAQHGVLAPPRHELHREPPTDTTSGRSRLHQFPGPSLFQPGRPRPSSAPSPAGVAAPLPRYSEAANEHTGAVVRAQARTEAMSQAVRTARRQSPSHQVSRRALTFEQHGPRRTAGHK